MTENRLLLQQLIGYLQNDLAYEDVHQGKIDVKKEREVFNSMIIAVTRDVNDIRYCSRSECPCSPESDIKRIYENNKDIFQKTRMALYPIPWKSIENIISKTEVRV